MKKGGPLSVCEKATVNSIIENDWRPPELLSNIHDSFLIQQAFYSLCTPLEQDGKESLAQVSALIGHVCGMTLQFSDPKVPFREIGTAGGSRTANLTDLTIEHLDVIGEIEKRATNLFLKTRLNDVLWIKTRPYNRIFGEAACRAYLDLALNVSTDNSKLYYAKQFTLRAINIWRELGSNSDSREEIECVIFKCMQLENPEPIDFTRNFFYENLSEVFDPVDADKWIELGNTLIKSSKDQKQFEKARKYLTIQRRFYKSKKDTDSIAASRRIEVQLFIEEAKEKKDIGSSPTIVQHFLNKAFEAARNTPGMNEEAKQLKAEMVTVQMTIPESFKEFSTPAIDLRPEIEAKQAEMQGKSIRECIQMIAEAMIPAKKEQLYQRAKEHFKGNPIQSFITMTLLDEKGKLIAKRPGIGSSPEEDTAALRAEASQWIHHSVAVRGTILRWMRREICNRVEADEQCFDFLLYPNPFVPNSRIYQYRQGFQRGLSGDWISCVSILVPQLENSLRTILHLSGVDIISIDSEGIQQEKDLGSFIYGDEFKALFGEDMAFQLQVILTDKTGFNIRNQAAHGLLTDSMALSEIGPVIWSLTLLLCLSAQRAFIAPVHDADEKEK